MISMKKGKLLELNAALKSLERVMNTKFAHAVSRNQDAIEDEIKAIQKSGKMSPGFTEYEKKRFDLVKKFAKLDANGKMIENPDRTVVMENLGAFEAALEPIRLEYKDALDEREKQIKDFEEDLEEEYSFEPFLIAWKNTPDDLRADELRPILKMMTGSPDDMPVKEKKDKCQESGH
jgi:hypothetical protein